MFPKRIRENPASSKVVLHDSANTPENPKTILQFQKSSSGMISENDSRSGEKKGRDQRKQNVQDRKTYEKKNKNDSEFPRIERE